jgi:peroxiredoxin
MPLIKSKLDTYFEKVLLQLYDSVKPAAYQLIKKVEPYPQMFRFVISYLLNGSLSSRIMGMDALFVDIARDYYLQGKASWADSTTLAKIRENVIFMEHNLVGNKAPDIKMETFDGQPFRLYQQNSKYIILALFEPNCSHCLEYIPRLYEEVYIPYRDKGLEVIAGYTMDNKKEWGDFIEKHHLTDWVNVWDEHHLSRFKIIYDTRTTPAVYLLDKDKKIIAKKVTVEFLKDYLEYYLGGESGK